MSTRSNRRTPEAIAERDRRAQIVQRAAGIYGGSANLARLSGRGNNVYQYISGYSRAPDSLIEICERIIKEHENMNKDQS